MTYEDLMEAIADRISELWPERMLYRDFCPSDFKRPSGFLYVVKAGYTDANAGLVRWDFSAELTLYAATDAYTVESTEALRAEQNKVLRQFGGLLFRWETGTLWSVSPQKRLDQERHMSVSGHPGSMPDRAMWTRTRQRRVRAGCRR